MINKTIQSPNDLISSLKLFQNEGFIFRGHSDGKYILQPSAYRKDSLIKLAEIYPESVACIRRSRNTGPILIM